MIDDPDAQAEAARRALHALAGATERMNDRHELGAVLASLSAATASLSESLHQLATARDHSRGREARPRSRNSQLSQYPMSWELHRAGEILHQVSTLLQHARDAAAHDALPQPQVTQSVSSPSHSNHSNVAL